MTISRALTLLVPQHRVLMDLQASQEPQVTLDLKETRLDARYIDRPTKKYVYCKHLLNHLSLNGYTWCRNSPCPNGSRAYRETVGRVNLVPGDHQDLRDPQDQDSDL